jgi:hypothetical protein
MPSTKCQRHSRTTQAYSWPIGAKCLMCWAKLRNVIADKGLQAII